MQQQPAADIVLVHRLQAGDADRADIGGRPLGYPEAHVQQVLGRPQVHRRQFHLGEGVTGLANRRQQSLLRCQHVGGHRRRTRRQAELIACRRRHIALDRHTPQVEQRSRVERGHHRDRRVGRCLLQQVGQIGLVERLAGHRHSHLRRRNSRSCSARSGSGRRHPWPGPPGRTGPPAPFPAAPRAARRRAMPDPARRCRSA